MNQSGDSLQMNDDSDGSRMNKSGDGVRMNDDGVGVRMGERSSDMKEDTCNQFFNKLIEAGKLQREAFLMLAPESTRPHLMIIGDEMDAMTRECLTSCTRFGQDLFRCFAGTTASTPSERVHKVDIEGQD